MIDLKFEITGPDWDDLEKKIIKSVQDKIRKKLRPVIDKVDNEDGTILISSKKDGSMTIDIDGLSKDAEERVKKMMNEIFDKY